MEPTFNDYVALIYNRFEAYTQASAAVSKMGAPFVYQQRSMIAFFMWMQFKRISQFKTQWRWLKAHPEAMLVLGWSRVPDRSTLSRRYKALYPVLEDLVQFLGQSSAALGDDLKTDHLYEDKSLFKAQGPVWHQSDRQAGRIPDKLRHLDTDATWSKSGYHGWVYGYSLHLTCNRTGFPRLVHVETASIAESQVLEQKKEALFALDPQAITADNAYFKAMRVRQWAAKGVILLTPAVKWQKGRYARAYHRFIAKTPFNDWLKCRKTAIEPVFDLFAKVLGTANNHKQLPLQRLPSVRTFLCLGVLAVQIAMIVNNAFGLPLRQISNLLTAFS